MSQCMETQNIQGLIAMSYSSKLKNKIKKSAIYLLLLMVSLLINTIISPINAAICDDYFILNLYEDDTDSIYQIHKFNDQNSVLSFTPINTNLETTGISGINARWFNTLSYNPVDSRLYGIVYDRNDPLYPMYLYSMTVTGSNITNHGVIHAGGTQNLTRDFGSYPAITFTDGQSFTQQVTNYTPGDEDDEGYTATYFSGAINPAGTHLYLFHFDDYHILKVDLATQKFTVLQQDTVVSSIASGDFSFDSAGFLYAIKQDSSDLVRLSPEAGTASSIALTWQGLAPINITYPAHLLLRDDNTAQFIHRYGTHDLDNDGVTREYTGPVLYEVTISTGIVSAVKAVDSQYNDWTFDDVAGCATALSITEDYGDAPQGLDLSNGYDAATYPVTTANDGARHTVIAGVCLGTAVPANCSNHIDTEVAPAPHINATTDGLDDGVQINPNDSVIGLSNQAIIYTNRFINGTDVNVDNEVVITASAVGFINIWLDINQDGDWNDTVNGQSELVATSAVIQGDNSITFTIPSSSVHGPSYLRVRYASNAADIATVTGLATDGEVEDYLVNIAAPSLAITGCNVGMIQNGGFDIPAGTPSQGLTDEYFREENVPGWSIGPHSVGSFITYDWDSSGNLVQSRERYGPGNATTPTGGNIAELNTFIPQMYYQDIVTEPGQILAWDFYWSPRRKTSGGDQQAEMRMGTPDNLQQVQLTDQKSSTDVGFIQYTGIYTVPANQYITRVAWLPVQWASDGEGNLIDGINVGCVPSYDYGDAPDNGDASNNAMDDYTTLLATNGPYHQIPLTGSVAYLGSNAPDSDDGTLANTQADSDDTTEMSIGIDDEDAISTLLSISDQATAHTLTIPCNGHNSPVFGWIDINQNGIFEAALNEQASANCFDVTPNVDGSVTLNWNGWNSSDVVIGETILRLRIVPDSQFSGQDSSVTPEDERSIITAVGGEIEDHRIKITRTGDYGDAPDDGTNATFHTLLDSNGPVHEIGAIAGIYLGDIEPDMDPGTYQDIDANQDDANDNSALRSLSDEDAVNNVILDSSKSTFTLNVPCNDFVAGDDLEAIVHGWIDFNGNQQFERSEYAYRECIDVDEVSTGMAILRWIDIAQVQEGTSYLRLRITNQLLPQDLGTTTWDEASTGDVVGGEVEDHKITFSQASDFGDAPDIYKTLSSNNGAEHGLGSYRYSLYLGSIAADADSDGFSNGTENNVNTATDDNNTDTSGISAGNDEDAVTGMPGFFIDSTDYQIDVVCNDHDGNADLGANVYGWVDFDNNGSFDVSNNEFAQATCDDTDAISDGSATLSFTGFTAATVPATTFSRLRITTQTLGSNDSAGFAVDGEVEDYAVIIGFKVSGKVFTDSNSAVTDGMNYYNGNLDAGELGIGNVVVTLYDVTTNTCQSTTTDINGDYALAALTNHQYKLYETANEMIPAPSICPPEVGAVNSDGLLINNTITDPAGYTSSSSNIIDLGTITSDDSGNNFADISAPGFASCDADGYLSLRTPTDLFAVDLFTGDTEELAANITSTYNSGGLQVGYMMQYNHIIGDISQTNAKLIGLIDGNYNVHLLPITLTGSNINIAFNNATISDDGILYMTGGNTAYLLKVDVNPASETYLQEVGRPSISKFDTADFAINPVDGKLYGLRANGTIASFDPATNSRSNSRSINTVISAGITRGYNAAHFSSSYGAIYFDQAGNMYAVNNGTYSKGNIAAPVLQIPIGDGSATNYTATIVSNLGFTMSSNDGARCRYAPLGLDFGDAPDGYLTLNSSSGPYHVTRNNTLWIGDNKPDNDVDGLPQMLANGDDTIGTTPDDEDGFDNQVRVFINNTNGSITVPITNNSGKSATLYAWVDFNQSDGFELSERASAPVSATVTQANISVSWSGLSGVVTGDTYLRLRLCTDDATVGCDVVSGPASNGEVEDHLAKVIEGVFPDTTCDGIYQSSGSSATSFDFGALTTTLSPYNVSNIISHQTGFDNLNAIAFDRIGGVFYGSFVDSGNNLHIAMFDKLGNMVDVGMPTANTDFDIVNVTTGVITSITTGNPIIAPTTLVGQLGTIDNNGEYLYLGHINSAQILRVNLNSFTVDTVNLLLPDIGLSSGNGLSLPFDSDWVFNAESGLIYTTELATRTLYIINPSSGAISATAIDFGTTIPNASSYGIVMGRNNFAYIMTNGDYDSDLNGSLESTGTALYQLNVLSKKALYLGSIPNAVATYSDAAGCIESAKDFGDASSSYGSVSHQFSDNNTNGVNDYSLGIRWDSEFNAHTSTNARDDNLYTLADEDGVIIPPQLQAGVNTISLVASEAGMVNIWLDYQRGGNFDSSEQLLTNYAVIEGNNAISLTLDSVAMGTYNGTTVMRVRYCAAAGQCDEFNDIEQGMSAVNGEVEDYQVWTSAVLLVTNSCNNLTLSHGTSGSFSLETLQPQATPFTTTKLQQPVVIAGLSNFDRLNALGIHPENYLIYGIATDTNTANDDVHLVVTDQSGVEVVDLGGVVSSVNQTLELISSTSIIFNKNQPLANSVNGIIMHTATRGAIDPAGEYLYLHHEQWQSLIKVDIQDQTFTVVSLQNTLTPMGGDMAFSHTGYLYNADILNGLLYRLDPIGGTADTLALNWLGASMPSAGGVVGAAFMDSGIFLYVVTKNGSHDIDRDGSLEHSGSAMYRINTLTGDIVAIAAMGEIYTDNLDGAGCFVSADYGDSAAINDGNVSHQFYDNDADGVADYRLGTLLDPELTQFNSSNGLGDDNHDIDDEDGVNMPTSIVVNSIVNVDVTVTNQNTGTLKLNVWADMNGNGSYRDSGEQIVNELDVTNGINTVQLLLPAAYTQGYSGNSTIRFRLCAQANQCNAPDDNQLGMVALNGEVEDYPFELINQIIIKGFVFEDNAAGGATAHDGIMSHSEVGLGRFTVQAIYQGSSIAGYNTGDILATVRTRGNGSYELLLPVEVATQAVVIDVIKQSAWIDISESDLQSITQATSTSVIDSQITVVANAGDNVEYLNFGKVKSLRLEADNFTHVELGKFVFLPHRLETYTAGSVSFAITNAVITPANSSWSIALYRDHNCNRQLDSGDNSLSAPISVTGYDTVCLLSKVFVPNNAVLNSQAYYAVNATMIFEDLLLLGHGITRVVTDLDTIRVTFAGAGELVLEKTVNNITQATGKLTQNIAKPNDILQYEIVFANVGTGTITDVIIFDDTPAYTYLKQALDCNDFTYPITLTCSVHTDNGSNINGYEGLINVKFIGELQPSEKGVIYYQVQVK